MLQYYLKTGVLAPFRGMPAMYKLSLGDLLKWYTTPGTVIEASALKGTARNHIRNNKKINIEYLTYLDRRWIVVLNDRRRSKDVSPSKAQKLIAMARKRIKAFMDLKEQGGNMKDVNERIAKLVGPNAADAYIRTGCLIEADPGFCKHPSKLNRDGLGVLYKEGGVVNTDLINGLSLKHLSSTTEVPVVTFIHDDKQWAAFLPSQSDDVELHCEVIKNAISTLDGLEEQDEENVSDFDGSNIITSTSVSNDVTKTQQTSGQQTRLPTAELIQVLDNFYRDDMVRWDEERNEDLIEFMLGRKYAVAVVEKSLQQVEVETSPIMNLYDSLKCTKLLSLEIVNDKHIFLAVIQRGTNEDIKETANMISKTNGMMKNLEALGVEVIADSSVSDVTDSVSYDYFPHFYQASILTGNPNFFNTSKRRTIGRILQESGFALVVTDEWHNINFLSVDPVSRPMVVNRQHLDDNYFLVTMKHNPNAEQQAALDRWLQSPDEKVLNAARGLVERHKSQLTTTIQRPLATPGYGRYRDSGMDTTSAPPTYTEEDLRFIERIPLSGGSRDEVFLHLMGLFYTDRINCLTVEQLPYLEQHVLDKGLTVEPICSARHSRLLFKVNGI